MKNKNILFSVDGIIGYREEIEEVLKKKFKIVKYIDHYIPPREKRSIFFKILRELSKRFKSSFIHKYFNSIVRDYYMKHILNFTEKMDYFFVIAGREFSKEFIQDLKKKNPGIVCIIFLWDKLEYTTLRNSIEEFDYVFSFDPEDCKKYNFIFRPIFSTKLEKEIEYSDRKYDFSYIAALRDKKRYEVVWKLYKWLSKKNKKFFIRLVNLDGNNIKNKYDSSIVSEERISPTENLRIFRESRVILDVPFSNQNGLTIRAIQSLFLGVKIITTNQDIKNYDFYLENNIKVISEEKDIEIEYTFFSEEYEEISEDIKQRYSVEGFINFVMNTIQKEK